MNAIVVARIIVTDPEKMKAYGVAAAPTIADHGGTFLVRGKHVAALLGNDRPHVVAIIQFPSTEAAHGWFGSPEYQALQGQRDAAAEMQFTLYEAA